MAYVLGMRVILFGATGMVGQAVLRGCLADPAVERVLTVGRRLSGQEHEKLRELVPADLWDLSGIADALTGYDACCFCLGVSAAGMSEQDYRRITYDLTLSVAQTLVQRNPGMTFIYVSGGGTDEHGRMMWARVKGETESALMRLPFKAAYMFRPGYIQPLDGEVSRTRAYQILYRVMAPFYGLWKVMAPGAVTSTRTVAHAMLEVARQGAPKRVLENRDINSLGA